MILKDLTFLDNLQLDEYKKFFGNKSKEPNKNQNHRSSMMLNPLNLKHLNSIDNSIADVITINLEDAIAPSRKKEALYNTAMFLSHLESSTSTIIVRINPLNNGGTEEMNMLNEFSFDAYRVPKVRNSSDVELALKLSNQDKEIHISLETKEAFSSISSLKVDNRVTTANLGILDLLVSLGLPQSLITHHNPTVSYILSKFLVDCRSANIHPVSFMYQEYENREDFRKWCEIERQMGFTSKACMGPKQVVIANEIFGINEHEIQRALEIKKLFEDSSSSGINGFISDDYGFIDEPIYKDALNILIMNKNYGM
jgi:citrate lyase subunit beta/citryl-CoA lyase